MSRPQCLQTIAAGWICSAQNGQLRPVVATTGAAAVVGWTGFLSAAIASAITQPITVQPKKRLITNTELAFGFFRAISAGRK